MIDAAREIRDRLAAKALKSFVKTSGGKGLHVVLPLVAEVGWDSAKAFTKEIADAMAADSPDRYVATMAKKIRGGRIFVDYLRNGQGATAVAPYSTRARAGATVSVPLEWEELSDAIHADHFSVANLSGRLTHLAHDPWADIGAVRQRLPSTDAEPKRRSPATRSRKKAAASA